MTKPKSALDHLARLITTLADKLDLTDRQIADILWLALKRQEFEENPSDEQRQIRKPNDRKTQASTDTPVDETDSRKADIKETSFPKLHPTQKAPVYTSGSFSQGQSLPIRVPDAPSLREPIHLAQSLHLLMRRVPTGRRTILDEVATVDRIAKEKVCLPVLRSEPESWLDLALVIDESQSMLIWRQTIGELRRLLENYGIFRDLRVWGIKLDEEGKELQIFSRMGSNHRLAQAKEIVDPTGRRLVLVVSDCVSNLWRKGTIFPVLHEWTQKQPLAVIQMLPEWMWRRTALGLGTAVGFSSSIAGVANRDLLVNKKFFWEERTKIPVLTLELEKTARWSQMLVGKADAAVSGYILPLRLNIEEHPLLQRQQQALSELNAPQRVARFRKTTSPLGRKLAGLLAAAPVISLPIVRLIQESLLPESRQVQVAEVFLAGLLKPKSEPPIEADTNPDAVEYEFIAPQIRDIFLEDAPVRDSTDVLNAVSRYVAEQMGKSLDEFMALLKTPGTAEGGKVKPFAEVTARILRNLGGEHLAIAQQLEQAAVATPQPGKHYAIAIGINQYQHFPNKTNQYALRDAQVMKDWFSQSGFTEVHSLSEANSGAFQSFLSSHFQPSSLTPTDTLWFYFSGLGVTVGERDYLLFSDSNLDDLEKTAISVGDLSKRLLQSGVGRLILLLDADRWGQWQYGKQRETLPPASALAQALRSQSGIDPRKQGLLVFYACLPDEGAYEIDLFQQGLFTYAFREAVRHGRGGDISAQKLYQSLRDRAIKLAQEYVVRASQTPELVAEPDSLREQILPLAPTFPFNLESFSVEVATIVFEEELPKLEFETLFVNKRGEITRRQQCEAYYYDQPLEVESSVPSEGGARGGLKSGESKFQNSLRMIYIPEGTFWMGSPEGEKDRSDDESPQHKVSVSPFFMSQTPITEAQWRFVAHLPQEQRELNPNPSSNGDEHPVVNVRWYDALEFCARLSLYTERNYRLPSEAEWEHACRAVNLGNPPVVAPTLAEWNEKYNQPFHFGETITSKLANYNGSVIYKQEPKGEYRSQTTPVRTFKPNAFGLYDLHGNVWEWCLDPWHNNYEGAPSDGRVWDEGKEELYEDVLTNLNILLQDTRTHVLRGGSWDLIPWYCRSAFRIDSYPRLGILYFGFRVLCVPPRTF
jgi:formylglycine-generating enzyme required for sulfatase activity